MSVITLPEPRRAEAAPNCDVSVEDLIRLQDRHPPSEPADLTPCICGKCDFKVGLILLNPSVNFDPDTDYEKVFLSALRSGKSRRETLFQLRDTMMTGNGVRLLLADANISRKAIVAAVHKRAAKLAWLICIERPRRPRCGVSIPLTSGTQPACYA